MIQTRLSRSIGLQYPIIVAPMFLVSSRELIVACAEAGILGTMPNVNGRNHEDFRADLEWIRSKTDRPFGINFTIKMMDPQRLEADLEACLEYQVPVLITSYGNPSEIVRRAHAKGVIVMHDAINLRHAKVAERAGVDAVIGVAAGAGGHAGTTSPFVLWPYLIQNLQVPVVAAGCIAGGAQVAASLVLGAELVYMGTRFLPALESAASEAYKQASINGTPEDILYTNQVSGVHGNFIRHTVPGAEGSTAEEHAKRWKEIWSAGQGISLATEIQPVQEIVQQIVREYNAATAILKEQP